MPSVVGVVPVRWNSRRWPGKALAVVEGRPLVEWAYDSLFKSEKIDSVYIATDDTRIVEWASEREIPCLVTSSTCRNGTERIAEAAKHVIADYYVNVQADQVGLEPATIDSLGDIILTQSEIPIATVATTVEHEQARSNHDTVFVEIDESGYAKKFVRGGDPVLSDRKWLRHLGVYAYRRNALIEYAATEPTPNEQRHSLEQLRALESGWKIGVVTTSSEATSYDRPVDS